MSCDGDTGIRFKITMSLASRRAGRFNLLVVLPGKLDPGLCATQ